MRILLPVLALCLLLPGMASAQSIAIDMGDGGSVTATSIQLIALITVLSLAPGLAIMITCFPFIVTVLAILRQGIGLQQSPPNMLIVSLALFLTYFVMEPVFTEAWETGIQPLLEEQIEVEEAAVLAIEPFRDFMAGRADPDTYMSMGMMMVPPAIVSLPFKLAFFVIADGWALIAGSLVRGYF